MKLTKNFNSSEFACKHCCGKEVFFINHVLKLQRLHDYFTEKYKLSDNFKKIVVIINSAYRCKRKHKNIYLKMWNKLTEQQKTKYKSFDDYIPWGSQHLKGNATDIDVYIVLINGDKIKIKPQEVYEYCDDKFDGLGIYNTFVHCDSRGYKARWDERS